MQILRDRGRETSHATDRILELPPVGLALRATGDRVSAARRRFAMHGPRVPKIEKKETKIR
jgi:hypothetical protein